MPTPIQRAATPTSAQEAVYDATLVQRFKDGDESAFTEMMGRHRTKTFNIALRMLHNRADAEEITQDTFVRAYAGLQRFRGESSLATWLNRIAVNLSRNRYWYLFRRHQRDKLSLDYTVGENAKGTLADLIAADVSDPAEENVRDEFTTMISACMEKLDPQHREILTLRNVRDLPYDEIAQALHLSTGTVKSRIARARENLRHLLEKMCPEFASVETSSDYFLRQRATYGRLSIAGAAAL